MPKVSQPRNRCPMEPAMIQAKGSVYMRDATLTMSIQQTNEANGESALNLLRANCSLAALVDANERYDPPRCTEATRRNIIQRMENWVCDDCHGTAPSSMFWLYGGAGAGKSALAQTLAEKFKRNDDLAASFFFLKADVNRNDGDRLIPTLALQLVQSFEGLAPFVERKILHNPALFKMSRQIQMLDLLIQPLMMLSLEETDSDGVKSKGELKLHPRLVVIDGLDECLDSNTQCDLLRIIASAIPHFPYPLRFLITSRPESHITRVFQYDVGSVAQYDLSDDSDAHKDIRIFLEGEFAEIRRTHPLRQHLPSQWPPWADISAIVERSSSHFIYASTVIRFIQSPKHRPDDRLLVILGLKQPYEKDRPFARLDSLYRLIFLEVQDPSQLEKIHRAIGIVYLRNRDPGGLFRWGKWNSDLHIVEVLLELRPGDIVLLFDALFSLIAFDRSNIRIFHKSLFDYLLDSSRSGDLRMDLGLAYESAATYILKTRKCQGSWDLTEFQHFAYHCQFARLNDTLTDQLHSLACDPQIAFTNSLSELLVPSEEFSLPRSMLYFLQVIGRLDFDSAGDCYRKYIEKKTQYLRSAVPWNQQLKNMMRGLPLPEIWGPTTVTSMICASLGVLDWSPQAFGLEDLQPNGFGRKTPVAVASVEQEHEMFSSYLNARYRNPDTVISFLESSAGLIHSCHFVQSRPSAWLIFMMLMTYTKHGVRLCCTEFELSNSGINSQNSFRSMVEEHHQSVTRRDFSKIRTYDASMTTLL